MDGKEKRRMSEERAEASKGETLLGKEGKKRAREENEEGGEEEEMKEVEGVVGTENSMDEDKDAENETKGEKRKEKEEMGSKTFELPTGDSEAFMKSLQSFFEERDVEFRIPKFYGTEVDVHKLWTIVYNYGGYDAVTSKKLWKAVGENFDPPKSCTTISYSFRSFYEKSLLDYERHVGRPAANDSSPAGSKGKEDKGSSPGSKESGGGGKKRTPPKGSKGERGDGGAEEGGAGEEKEEDRSAGAASAGTGVGHRSTKKSKQEDSEDLGVALPANRGKRGGSQSTATPSGASGFARISTPGDSGAVSVVDEGQPADWVRVNVRKSEDMFEIYALVPGLLREEIRVQCEGCGKVVVYGEPEAPDNPWGVTPFKKIITLPMSIRPHETTAVVTLHGQLYIRAPLANTKSKDKSTEKQRSKIETSEKLKAHGSKDHDAGASKPA